MKTIIASALGILFLAGPIESAQPMPIMPTWSNRRLIEQDRARKEAARRAYENSPEGIRQELARLREELEAERARNSRDRLQQLRDQQARDSEDDARQLQEWRDEERQRNLRNGTRYSTRR